MSSIGSAASTAYRVEIARNAEAGLEDPYLWVVERAPHQSAKWFNGLERAVLSLDQHPKRCPVAPESIDPDEPIRVLSSTALPQPRVAPAQSSRRTTIQVRIMAAR